ncbi:hypothetical protein B0H17DRAFT_1212365 [Mycena rosella]|uniref:Uncharacterized protein n=1 Tax=Mycena rosella TaxID=1033263 RepID=A0AAD7CVY5_MYCRO|nr:hypothetical protein B0H17DRAFT_1212365 [Mycena rosella]
MAPIPVLTSYAGSPSPQSFFMKYQALFIILFLAIGFAIIFSIEPVFRMVREWRKGEDVEDVEAASVRDSFKPPTIALPPPSLSNYSIQAEMAEHRAHLERDPRYMGYVSQGKMLSGKGRSFF